MYRVTDLCADLVLENRYTLIRQLGKGGFATVWEVADLQANGDRKAIKVCNGHRLEQVNQLRLEFCNLEEVQSHWQGDRRIVRVENFYPQVQPQAGDRIPLHFFVMERVDGKTLRELISELAKDETHKQPIDPPAKRPIKIVKLIEQSLKQSLIRRLFYRYPPLRSHLSYVQIAHLLEQLAEVLHYLHSEHNYILRDLNPNNIMVTQKGEIKLIDFGAVRKLDRQDQKQYSNYVSAFDQKSVTRVVTYGYAAPEQKDGQAHFRSDFYSLGQTMLFALTGRDADKVAELRLNWRSQVPIELVEFIDKATNADPLKRHADAGKLLDEAQQIGRSLRHQFGKGAPMQQLAKMLGIAAIATFSTIGMRATGIWQAWEFAAYDQMLRMRPSLANPHKITVVAIQPDDAKWMGERDVSNQNLARAIANLLPHQPKAIGIAIARDQSGQNRLGDMQKLLQEHEHIFGSCEPQSLDSAAVPFQPKPSAPLGFDGTLVDTDNYYRRHSLFFPEDLRKRTIDEQCPAQLSFNLLIANHYLQKVHHGSDAQILSPSSSQPSRNLVSYSLGQQKIPSLREEGAYQGFSYEGFDYTFQVLVDYQPISQIITKVSLRDVSEQKIAKELISDRVILIGRIDESIDLPRDTPYGAMHSVEMRAQIISYLIDLGEGKRRILQPASWWLDSTLMLVIALISSFIGWRFPSQRDRLLHWLFGAAILWLACYFMLLWQSLWLAYVPFTILSLLAIMGEFAYTTSRLAITQIYASYRKGTQKISNANYISDDRDCD